MIVPDTAPELMIEINEFFTPINSPFIFEIAED